MRADFKKIMMPWLAQFIASDLLRNSKRLYHKTRRLLKRRQRQVEVYLKLDDAYSFLLLQYLCHWRQKVQAQQKHLQEHLQFRLLLIDELPADYYPQAELWLKNSILDAGQLAKKLELQFPKNIKIETLAENIPTKQHYQQKILSAKNSSPEQWLSIFNAYWLSQQSDNAAGNINKLCAEDLKEISDWLTANQSLLGRRKQYLSALIWYEGEAYWGVDRFHHWLNRLFDENLLVQNSRPENPFRLPDHKQAIQAKYPLEMFFSARSPYSYLGLMKAIELANQFQLELIVKPVLPMVMRGLKVPNNKKWYIFLDTKREAKIANIDYGKVSDPLGKAVENCYAIYEYALTLGKGIDWLESFSIAVNARGISGESERGLAIICKNANIDWAEAKLWLKKEGWKNRCQQNQKQLAELNQWGVPCFRFGQQVFWGQDRLWRLQNSDD